MTIHNELTCDVLIAGGSLGGVAAALAAARLGKRVILTEECEWIGGQLTSQAVSCPDENPWVETIGCTQSYQQLRRGIRDFYRKHFPLKPEVSANPTFNPGNGWVSYICQEPRVGLAVLHEMLFPYITAGKIRIMNRTILCGAEINGTCIESLTFRILLTGIEYKIKAPYVIDATETGEILPLTSTQYVIGAESRQDTGEPNAVDGPARPDDVQSFTWCFLMDYLEGCDFTIDKPEGYEQLRDEQPMQWTQFHPITRQERKFILWETDDWKGVPLWTYRRVLDKTQFQDGSFPSDITLVNWPHNDYRGNFIDKPEQEKQEVLDAGKRLSFALLYWLQTEAPRPDGGQGFPGLRIRPDLTGTEDGLAQYPYVRESRRIIPEFRILELHISAEETSQQYAEPFDDSVGIGLYRIDLHPSSATGHYVDLSCRPFQIPLGALLPVDKSNLIAGCKNIGTTHISNGAYRLHPVEWNIGESAGALAAFCIDQKFAPSDVRANATQLEAFQKTLLQLGIPLKWPEAHRI